MYSRRSENGEETLDTQHDLNSPLYLNLQQSEEIGIARARR